MNKAIYSTIAIALIIFFMPLISAIFIREIPNDVQPSLEGTQIVFKETTIRQDFISPFNNLSGIGLSIKNPYYRNHKDLLFNIVDENNQIIRSGLINGVNIPDGDLIELSFISIPDSQNKEYSLILSSPDTSSNEALEVFQTSKRTSWIGDLDINSVRQNTSLSLILYQHPVSKLEIISGIIQKLQKRFFEDPFFSLPYLVIIASLVGYLLLKKK